MRWRIAALGHDNAGYVSLGAEYGRHAESTKCCGFHYWRLCKGRSSWRVVTAFTREYIHTIEDEAHFLADPVEIEEAPEE